jgi:multidrug efflux pump subunit AcrA (membrane-fusion protein)
MNNKKQKKSYIFWSIVGVVITALLAAVIFTPKGIGAFDEETAQMGTITTYYSFAGAVEAKSRQNIVSKKEMHIEEVLVKEGGIVKKGDVLLTNSEGEEIKAEIDGEVAKLYTKNNSHAMKGQQLVDIVDYKNKQIKVKVDEYDLKYITTNQEVAVTIHALEKEIQGTVSSISKEAINENGVSYFTAMIDFAKDESIRIGMSAEAKILKQNASDVTTLPMKAIQFDASNKAYVMVPSDKGKPIKKYIQIGMNDGTVVEVKEGMKTGDKVYIPQSEEQQDATAMHGGNES